MQQGDIPQAYDVLCGSGATSGGAPAAAAQRGGQARLFRMAALRGVLRHRQWLNALGGAAPAVDVAATGVLGLPLRAGAGRGQGMAEGWARDAERHLKVSIWLHFWVVT
jgi:hypothetical protein